ncbi:ankyrin repeat-containing protein [Anaeramoeba flamelloides]|uniref:Ankyrin repeat-containing protein n=1 Tax=Anaeramoeba flamelloides TaxID=1746091 RepID=A0ABQ8YMA0_9EUKA|nr:ankyrin repeat-containing protein [Anaeramoeba flamelloides]
MIQNKESFETYPFVLSNYHEFPTCDKCEIRAASLYCQYIDKSLCRFCYKEEHADLKYDHLTNNPNNKLLIKDNLFFNIKTFKLRKSIPNNRQQVRKPKKKNYGIQSICLCGQNIKLFEIILQMGITWNTSVMGGYNLYQEVFYNKIRKIEWYYLYVNSYLNINGMNSGKPVDEIFPDLSTKTNYLIQDPKLYDLILKNLFERPDYYLALFWNEKKSKYRNQDFYKKLINTSSFEINRIYGDKKETFLHCVCKKSWKYFEIIQLLLEKGIDVDGINKNGDTALLCLCRNEIHKIPVDIFKIFFKKSTLILHKDNNQKTAFYYYLINNSNIEIIKLFLNNGETILDKQYTNGKNALHQLFTGGDINKETIQFYLKLGFKLHQMGNNLQNCFHSLCYKWNNYWKHFHNSPYLIKNVDRIKNDKLFEIIEFLIDQKFDFNQKDIKQNSSLHYLNRIGKKYCFRPPIKILTLLLQKGGADPNIQDKNNKTILHYYSENFQSTSHLIKLFIENGANPNIRDDQLQTPFHKIIRYNKFKISEIKNFIIDYGIDTKLKDKNGHDLLHFYQESGGSNNTIKKFLALNFYCLKEDLVKTFSRKDDNFMDSEIKGIKFHKLLVEWRTKKNIKQILTILEKYPKNNISDFFNWIYSDQIPESYLKYKKEKKNEKVKEMIQEIQKKNENQNQNNNENSNPPNSSSDSSSSDSSSSPILSNIPVSSSSDGNDHDSNNDDSEDEELKEKKEKERKEKQILNQNFDNIFEEFEIKLDNKNFNLEKSIKDLFSDEKSKNFTIVIDKTKEEIKVHKFILYSRSGLYNGMFLNIDNKNINKVTDYSQRSLEAMKIFIEYLYTDRIDQDKLSQKIKNQLYDAADFYQLNPNCSFDFYLGKRL